MDTLRPDVFKALTRRGRHHDLLAGHARPELNRVGEALVNLVLVILLVEAMAAADWDTTRAPEAASRILSNAHVTAALDLSAVRVL